MSTSCKGKHHKCSQRWITDTSVWKYKSDMKALAFFPKSYCWSNDIHATLLLLFPQCFYPLDSNGPLSTSTVLPIQDVSFPLQGPRETLSHALSPYRAVCIHTKTQLWCLRLESHSLIPASSLLPPQSQQMDSCCPLWFATQSALSL